MAITDDVRRLINWLTAPWRDSRTEPPAFEPESAESIDSGVEYPWRHRWDHLPKRTAGFGFSQADYRAARERAEEIARLTLGDDLWSHVRRVGHVDIPSRHYPGVTYRLRVGRRIEVRCGPGVQPPWPQPFLCINPTYPLPEAEFFAHLFLYARDHEEELIRVAAPQPWDQALGRTF